MNKKIASEVAVGVILVLVFIIGGIFWMRKGIENSLRTDYRGNGQPAVGNTKQPIEQAPIVNKDEQQQTKTIDETANWQTYKNEKLGFEFKYPNNVETEQNMNVDYFSLSIGNIVRPTPTSDYLVDSTFLMDVKKTNFKDINSWFSHFKKNFEKPSNYEGYTIHPTIGDVENFKIDNLDAKKYIPNEGKFPFYDRCVVFIKNGFEYSFCYSGVLNNDEQNSTIIKTDKDGVNEYNDKLIESIKNGYRKKFDQIISTIKFSK